MHSDHKRYFVIPGDLCKYTLKCVCCDTSITLPGTIGETVYHAPIAMIHHLKMINHEDRPMNTFDLSHVPVLFLGMDTFVIGHGMLAGKYLAEYRDLLI